MDIGVACHTCLGIYRKIEEQCPVQETTTFCLTQSRSLNNTTGGTCSLEANTVITALGAVTGTLVIFLLGTVTALVAVCIVLKKR